MIQYKFVRIALLSLLLLVSCSAIPATKFNPHLAAEIPFQKIFETDFKNKSNNEIYRIINGIPIVTDSGPMIDAALLNDKEERWIRVRIVIEQVNVGPINISATTIEDVNADFLIAEQLFKDVNLKFSIESVSFVKYTGRHEQHKRDAILYPHYMSVYYMLPNDFFLHGYSTFPWEDFPVGILLGAARDKYTLSHEIGHYFGLYHTFYEFGDQCSDTEEQIDKTCEDEDKSPNCGNIMSYCTHGKANITPNQSYRMKRYLLASRMNVVTEAPDSNADLTKLLLSMSPTQAIELIQMIFPDENECKPVNIPEQPTTQPTTQPGI